MSPEPKTPRTAPNGGCYAIDFDRSGNIADGFSRCSEPPVATMQPSEPGEYSWRMCERHARGAESMPMGRYVERDFRVGTCGHSAHAHPDAPCPDRLGIIGALPPPGHADYGCQVPLPDTKPIPVDGVGAGGAGPLTITVMDGASVAAALAKPEAKAAIRDQVSAAVRGGAATKAAYEHKREEARMKHDQARGFDAAFRARAEAAGWRVLAPEPEPDPFHCMMDGCAGSRQQRAGAGRWCRPAVTEYSREPYWACTPCLRARLDSRDATGGFAPGNARGGWPFDGTRGPDEAAMRAAQAAPPPPKPEVPMFAKGGIREPAPTPRTDDSPTEACVPFPPARIEWGYRATCAECGVTRIHSDLAECPLVCIHCAPAMWARLSLGEQWWYLGTTHGRAPKTGDLITHGDMTHRHLGGHAGNWEPVPAVPAKAAQAQADARTPASPKFERRDHAYCGALCGGSAVHRGVAADHTPHTAICDAKHAAHGGTIACPGCGCTDEYERFSSHGRCESCQIALCVEAVRRNEADHAAKAIAKAIRENLPPERYPPRGWDAQYSVFGHP